MAGIIHFESFLIAGILLNLTPGNDTIFILSRSITQGRKAGVLSVLGIASGSIIHTLLAAFGLSLIIAKSILIFNIIKYAGEVYLLYIGFKMIRSWSLLNIEGDTPKAVNYSEVYRSAIFTNVLNPKVTMFFIAFLPQFIDPSFQHTLFPFLMLGLTFIITGTTWCFILALFASIIFEKLKGNKQVSGYLNEVCGAVLIGLGIKIILSHGKQ